MKKPDKRWTIRLGALALSAALLGERLTGRKLAGVAAILAGMLILSR